MVRWSSAAPRSVGPCSTSTVSRGCTAGKSRPRRSSRRRRSRPMTRAPTDSPVSRPCHSRPTAPWNGWTAGSSSTAGSKAGPIVGEQDAWAGLFDPATGQTQLIDAAVADLAGDDGPAGRPCRPRERRRPRRRCPDVRRRDPRVAGAPAIGAMPRGVLHRRSGGAAPREPHRRDRASLDPRSKEVVDEVPGHRDVPFGRGHGRHLGVWRGVDLRRPRCSSVAAPSATAARSTLAPTTQASPSPTPVVGSRLTAPAPTSARPRRVLGDASGGRDADVLHDDLVGEADRLRTWGHHIHQGRLHRPAWPRRDRRPHVRRRPGPLTRGIGSCRADLLEVGVPPGEVTFSFDVFGEGVPVARVPGGA